jgi:probable rRNA maturation factor
MVRALQLGKGEVSLLLTDDDQIKELNRIYRKKNRPTDVLAFAQREGEHGDASGRILGDVIVSVPTAARQASAAGRPVLDEVTMLVAHGILHLLGWDHDTDAKDRAMRRETDRLCMAARRAQIGLSRAR